MASLMPRAAANPHAAKIAAWLLVCCGAIFAMVVLGGVTRLTGSGLSIVEWEPIMGAVPPLSEEAWQEAFHKYQQSPEFRHKNYAMDLEGFKGIFLVEYSHRLLGRLIGVIFLLPMLYFYFTRKLSRDLAPKLVALFVLGGLQGLLGWYMVKSGLIDDPHVSQYRLAAHLGMAFIIYGYMFWVALDLLFPQRDPAAANLTALRRYAQALAALIFVTVLSGALVAGLKAGLVYNTFPLMGDRWIPDEIFWATPAWRNFFENEATVQFDHRVLAMTVFAAVCAFWLLARRALLAPRGRVGTHLLLAAAVLQVTLGISTLVLEVPIPLAAAHQAGALLLFTAVLFVNHALRRRVPRAVPHMAREGI